MECLQTACDSLLVLRGTIPGGALEEMEIHARFAAHRIIGEWFIPAPAVLEWIGEAFGYDVLAACGEPLSTEPITPPKSISRENSGKAGTPRWISPLCPQVWTVGRRKVRGRLRYFGKWSDPQAALKKWHAQKADLLVGRVPRPVGPKELLLHSLLNAFLRAKKSLLEQGQIVERSWQDYLETCKRLARIFGRETAVSHLGPEDFQRLRADIAKNWGPTRIGNEIRRCRMPFRWGVDNGYIPHVPRYGEAMKRPSAKVLRKHRSGKGKRMFDALQITAILKERTPP